MAGKTQWSIGTLMVIVLMVAVDCGMVRWCWTVLGSDWLGAGIILVTPMINILILGLLRMRAKPEKRRFWHAFEVVGWFLTTCLFVLCYFSLDLAGEPLDMAYAPIQRLGWWSPNGALDVAMVLLTVVLVYGLLPALASALVGWFHDVYRVMIVRRPGTELTTSLDQALEA